MKLTRFIFVTGGVVSSLGKGLSAASLGALLKERGFRVRLRKLDPYLNVDPGTMSPQQHGEVFVTQDGAETDLDLGHYERFTGVPTCEADTLTSGKIYLNVLHRERQGGYLGGTVQVIPHITDEIKARILAHTAEDDIVICEIGGTVGDIESLPFLEAIRQLRNDLGPERTLFLHVALVPYIATAGECKSKPAQHSVRELQRAGIQPDFLLCRCDRPLSSDILSKLALFCNISPSRVIEAPDVKTIYALPGVYANHQLDAQVCAYFGFPEISPPSLDNWKAVVEAIERPEGEITIALVGKYVLSPDAYKSVIEALVHGGIANRVAVRLKLINSECFEQESENALEKKLQEQLGDIHGLIVPGGFGERGAQGIMETIRFAREKKLPFLGICFGMQLALIETARSLAGFPKASSTEFGPTPEPLIALLTEWVKTDGKHVYDQRQGMGGTMRLGNYACHLQPGSKAAEIYGTKEVFERHRHRYEVNTTYRNALEKAGIVFSGLSPDGELVEIIERTDHPWFVAAQFHPEFKSRPFQAHPLFAAFIGAALMEERLV
ncbi:MAG: CTP synthase [Alphaproteobacteria bacterium]